jgi:hypothetical protein
MLMSRPGSLLGVVSVLVGVLASGCLEGHRDFGDGGRNEAGALCSNLACNHFNNTFNLCESPDAPYVHLGVCKDDERCMALDENACAADTKCYRILGKRPADYCGDTGTAVYLQCRFFKSCGLAITWAKNPLTQEVYVFTNNCVPLGWAMEASRSCSSVTADGGSDAR